jgi:hypothetical protein
MTTGRWVAIPRGETAPPCIYNGDLDGNPSCSPSNPRTAHRECALIAWVNDWVFTGELRATLNKAHTFDDECPHSYDIDNPALVLDDDEQAEHSRDCHVEVYAGWLDVRQMPEEVRP